MECGLDHHAPRWPSAVPELVSAIVRYASVYQVCDRICDGTAKLLICQPGGQKRILRRFDVGFAERRLVQDAAERRQSRTPYFEAAVSYRRFPSSPSALRKHTRTRTGPDS